MEDRNQWNIVQDDDESISLIVMGDDSDNLLNIAREMTVKDDWKKTKGQNAEVNIMVTNTNNDIMLTPTKESQNVNELTAQENEQQKQEKTIQDGGSGLQMIAFVSGDYSDKAPQDNDQQENVTEAPSEIVQKEITTVPSSEKAPQENKPQENVTGVYFEVIPPKNTQQENVTVAPSEIVQQEVAAVECSEKAPQGNNQQANVAGNCLANVPHESVQQENVTEAPSKTQQQDIVTITSSVKTPEENITGESSDKAPEEINRQENEIVATDEEAEIFVEASENIETQVTDVPKAEVQKTEEESIGEQVEHVNTTVSGNNVSMVQEQTTVETVKEENVDNVKAIVNDKNEQENVEEKEVEIRKENIVKVKTTVKDKNVPKGEKQNKEKKPTGETVENVKITVKNKVGKEKEKQKTAEKVKEQNAKTTVKIENEQENVKDVKPDQEQQFRSLFAAWNTNNVKSEQETGKKVKNELSDIAVTKACNNQDDLKVEEKKTDDRQISQEAKVDEHKNGKVVKPDKQEQQFRSLFAAWNTNNVKNEQKNGKKVKNELSDIAVTTAHNNQDDLKIEEKKTDDRQISQETEVDEKYVKEQEQQFRSLFAAWNTSNTVNVKKEQKNATRKKVKDGQSGIVKTAALKNQDDRKQITAEQSVANAKTTIRIENELKNGKKVKDELSDIVITTTNNNQDDWAIEEEMKTEDGQEEEVDEEAAKAAQEQQMKQFRSLFSAWNANNTQAENTVREREKASPSADSMCKVCQKRVYAVEKLLADGVIYHKTCFKCSHCQRGIGLGNYASMNGQLYCKPHFIELFKSKGNYEEGFGMEKRTKQIAREQQQRQSQISPSTADDVEQSEAIMAPV